jgi:hypothetical protein
MRRTTILTEHASPARQLTIATEEGWWDEVRHAVAAQMIQDGLGILVGLPSTHAAQA